MIARYSRPNLEKIWTDTHRFEKYLEVEIAATKAFYEAGIVPKDDYLKIRDNAKIDIKRIAEIEAETKHDLIAFTRCVSESLGDEKKWVHYGLTSTDVVDTANGLLLKEANEELEKGITIFLDTLKRKAIEYKDVPVMGRTHGQHAEITSFGLKYALWFDELQRNYRRFKEARVDVEVCKLSGAVGNYQTTTVGIESSVGKELGLKQVPIATQVLSRDRYAFYITSLALVSSTLEKVATEIRNLSRQEICEVSEDFSANQKGSSAMPHKRNPIGSENICGCARVMRSYVGIAFENNILWNERDISHSSAERIVFADATTLLDYMLARMNSIIEKLNVYPENMLRNINLTRGVIFSGAVLNKMVSKGYTREVAYDKVQKLAFETLFNINNQFSRLVNQAGLLDEKEIEEIFDIQKYLKHTDEILKNVGILEE